jgi:hypothetical protein
MVLSVIPPNLPKRRYDHWKRLRWGWEEKLKTALYPSNRVGLARKARGKLAGHRNHKRAEQARAK